MTPKKVKLKKDQLRKATWTDMNIGVIYYTLHDQNSRGITWTKWDYRGRMIEGNYIDGVRIYKGETEEEYKNGYVSQMKALVRLGLIFVEK